MVVLSVLQAVVAGGVTWSFWVYFIGLQSRVQHKYMCVYIYSFVCVQRNARILAAYCVHPPWYAAPLSASRRALAALSPGCTQRRARSGGAALAPRRELHPRAPAEDAAEGRLSFVEKREPVFRGR